MPPFLRTGLDVVLRSLIDSTTAVPDTPISVPLQQATSGLQDILPALFQQGFGNSRGPAALLGGAPPQFSDTTGTAGVSDQLATPQAAVPQFGRTQTREELGLPSRRETNFPNLPTPQELEEQDLIAPIRTTPGAQRGKKQRRKLEGRERRLEKRIAKRDAAGRPKGRAPKRLERTRKKLRGARI